VAREKKTGDEEEWTRVKVRGREFRRRRKIGKRRRSVREDGGSREGGRRREGGGRRERRARRTEIGRGRGFVDRWRVSKTTKGSV